MAFNQRMIDTLLQIGTGTVTADGYLQKSGADGIVDLGGDTVKGVATTARVAGVVEVQVTNADTADANESYLLILVGSNSSTLASGNVLLGAMSLGIASAHHPNALPVLNAVADGRYLIPFINEHKGVELRYLGLYVQVEGTTPSLTCEAYVSLGSEFITN